LEHDADPISLDRRLGARARHHARELSFLPEAADRRRACGGDPRPAADAHPGGGHCCHLRVGPDRICLSAPHGRGAGGAGFCREDVLNPAYPFGLSLLSLVGVAGAAVLPLPTMPFTLSHSSILTPCLRMMKPCC